MPIVTQLPPHFLDDPKNQSRYRSHQEQGQQAFALGNLECLAEFANLPTAKCDLVLSLQAQADGSFSGALEYDADLFDAASVQV